jgi:hypothetical protein
MVMKHFTLEGPHPTKYDVNMGRAVKSLNCTRGVPALAKAGLALDCGRVGLRLRANEICSTRATSLHTRTGARCHGGANWAKIGVSECRFQIPHSLGVEQSTECLFRCASRAKRNDRQGQGDGGGKRGW